MSRFAGVLALSLAVWLPSAASADGVGPRLRMLLSQAEQCTGAVQDKCSDDQQACFVRAEGSGTRRQQCCTAYLACLNEKSCNTGNLSCN